MEVYKFNAGELTSECWMIQLQGLEACKNCKFKNTDECGGKRIIKKLKENEKESSKNL